MLPLLAPLLGGVVKIVGGWIGHKQQVAEATRAAEIKWAHTMADASKTSWKDEYILFLWTLPVLLAILGYSEPMERFLQLLRELPQWYTGLLVTLSLATFGITAKGKWDTLISKRGFNNGQKATPSSHGIDFEKESGGE